MPGHVREEVAYCLGVQSSWSCVLDQLLGTVNLRWFRRCRSQQRPSGVLLWAWNRLRCRCCSANRQDVEVRAC